MWNVFYQKSAMGHITVKVQTHEYKDDVRVDRLSDGEVEIMISGISISSPARAEKYGKAISIASDFASLIKEAAAEKVSDDELMKQITILAKMIEKKT
jgi:threonine synthase